MGALKRLCGKENRAKAGGQTLISSQVAVIRHRLLIHLDARGVGKCRWVVARPSRRNGARRPAKQYTQARRLWKTLEDNDPNRKHLSHAR